MSKIPYIIGDIHGCLDELLLLEEKIASHAEDKGWQPLFVCVGDLVDRGPKSAEVVEHYRQGVSKQSHIVVMGNHESEFLRQLSIQNPLLFDKAKVGFPPFLYGLEEDFAEGRRGAGPFTDFNDFRDMMCEMWMEQGGRETLVSYGCKLEEPATWEIRDEHLQFLSNLPLFWQDDDLIVTHAFIKESELAVLRNAEIQKRAQDGLVLEKDLVESCKFDEQDLKEAAFSAMWSRTAPAARLHPHRVHVSGHTPLDHVKVSRELGFVQVDTGCVYGKRLTAYCHKDDTFLAVNSETFWLRSYH